MNILNNTVLIPSVDSLVSGNPLPKYNAAEKLENLKTGEIADDHFEYAAYIKVKDKSSVKLIAVQSVSGFGMEREIEQRPNSAGNYVINLPGTVKYSDIKITHLYTNDKFFLDWLTNGVSQGGIARTDMELHFWFPKKQAGGQIKKSHIIFTLYDAFPVSWEIENLNISGGQSLFEKVAITFSWLDYKAEAG